MNQKTKAVILLLFSLFLCFITYRLCYFIAEKYYFDKFFFEKSISHGYGFTYNPNTKFEKFGNRAKDVSAIYQQNNSVLGDTTLNNKFKIVIIGDSYTWGQGISNNQRFAFLLDRQLNKIRPSENISLALPGWNILNYLKIYQQITDRYTPDLIIFSLVSNDNTIYSVDMDLPLVKECLKKYPGQTPTFTYKNQHLSTADEEKAFWKHGTQAWTNPINSCILDNSLRQLPRDKSIFFITEDYRGDWSFFETFRYYLNKNNKYILSSDLGKHIPKYSQYFNGDPFINFAVSSKERHPNTVANQMYADVLFNEITTNPKWGFIK